MNTIIICGDHSERLLSKTILSACASYGGALILDGTKILQTSPEPEFTVLCVNSATEINCTGVIVFGDALCQVSTVLTLSGVCAVADSGCSDAVALLSGKGIPVIGCSSSDRDTLTLSCRNGGNIIASLQRSIRTVSGKIIEPCEISLHCGEDMPLYPALAVCAVLLICGIPYENGYELCVEER